MLMACPSAQAVCLARESTTETYNFGSVNTGIYSIHDSKFAYYGAVMSVDPFLPGPVGVGV